MSISSASELQLSLISFAGSDSTLTWQGGDKRNRRRQEGWGEGQLLKGGDYFKFSRLKGTINRGTAIIPGNTVSASSTSSLSAITRDFKIQRREGNENVA